MLKYISIDFSLKFSSAVKFTTKAEVVFRSAIGYHLHKISCVIRDVQNCEDCPIKENCTYAWFFESHISKDTKEIPGRNRASHPFLFEWKRTAADEGVLRVTFIGTSRNYIPFLIEAVRRAGENGVSKSRTRFEVVSITHDGKPYRFNMKDTENLCKQWPGDSSFSKGFLVFDTPCRIKEEGKYLSIIDLSSLIKSIQRRMLVLDGLYGDNNFEYEELVIPKNQAIYQKWEDVNYYSVRQQEALKLGGVKGKIQIQEEPNKKIQQLIEAAIIFHVGKNAGFGLGKIHYEKEGVFC